jgi:hypothetical protein
MVTLSVFLAILSGCAAAFFYTAQEERFGMAGWANDACSMANTLCLHPQWPAIAALVLLGVAVVLKVVGERG